MNNFGKRIQFKLIIHVFCEGKTEIDYLQKFVLQQKKSSIVKLNKMCINSDPIHLVKEAINHYKDLKNSKSQIWVVFDYDGRDQIVQTAINILKQSGKDIKLAFMKPCIEIWPLLHNNIDNVNCQQTAQSRLEEIMPSYKHDRNPYFDLSKMPFYELAVKKAHQWEVSLDGSLEYNAAKVAGIYKLTELIKKI
ncbi:MAG: RloB family protein [Alphaproteobacteria bacterium]|nr:RloB family protein [Alphaproteobacteria bacterium]